MGRFLRNVFGLFWTVFILWNVGVGMFRSPDSLRRPDPPRFKGEAVPGPSTFDPVVVIESDPPSSGSGTAFSIHEGASAALPIKIRPIATPR